jgi:hypothetical protein
MTQKKIYTEEELKFRENLSSRLSAIDGKLDNLHDKLTPILDMQATVKEHDRQIHRWQGINSVLATIAALAVSALAALYGEFRHFF